MTFLSRYGISEIKKKKKSRSSEAGEVTFIKQNHLRKKKKKVFDNLVNNVMIKLRKLVPGGSNLF